MPEYYSDKEAHIRHKGDIHGAYLHIGCYDFDEGEHEDSELWLAVKQLSTYHVVDGVPSLDVVPKFEELKRQLDLPEDYTILGITHEPLRKSYNVIVHSPSLPKIEEGKQFYSSIMPIYTRREDGTIALKELVISHFKAHDYEDSHRHILTTRQSKG